MSGLYKQLSENVAPFTVVYGIFLSLGEAGEFISNPERGRRKKACTDFAAGVQAPVSVSAFLRQSRGRLLSAGSFTALQPPSER